jgi:phosphoglucan,water dikinase
MTMLIRTENCQEWLRQSDGGDVFIDVSEALAASGGPGPGAGASPAAAAPPQQQHHDPPPPPPPQQQQHHHHEEKRAPPPPPPPPPQDDGGDHMALLSNWRGSAVELKGHREHNKDRHNQWNVDNLPDAARRIVEGDRDSPSWRQKLQALEGVLCFDDPGAMDMDALGYGAIYLFWVGVGAIACVEDGGHYRPNHHAKAAQHMYESIERVEKHHAGNGHVRALVRRLHPRLPAFTAEFTQQVPLTRIRDIAHGKGDRDGKCRDVRAEIKHTIQNKLHRCAGPEDLVATEAMLAKLTAPGTDYPEEFIEEFRIFHRELKDFFNASTVTDRLDKLQNEGPVPGEVSNACNAFVTAKYAVDALGANADGGVLLAAWEDALVQLCAARRVIDREVTDGGLSSGSADQRQQWRLAEIGLEDYAFVLLSRGINALGAESDPPKSEMNGQEMRAALKFLAAASDACALSAGGGNGEEFAHIAHEANELATAGPDGTPPTGEDGALRVRAVAERARRAAEDYCALLSELFDGRAETLGSSLGIDRGTIEVFTEGQIRASVVFQSAKLASHLLRAARKATGEAGWDCLVPGEVVGAKLVPVRRLDPTDPAIAALTAANPAVLLVQAADGDEEVSTCGPGVAGILLCHALPHLSHLALRARQAKVRSIHWFPYVRVGVVNADP